MVHGRINAQNGTYSDYYTTFTVTDVAPTVSVDSFETIAAGSPFAAQRVSGFSDPGYATPAASWDFTASINWGDGTKSEGTLAVNQGSASVLTTGIVSGTHMFAPEHSYTVTVTVEDSNGKQGSGSFKVTVGAPRRDGQYRSRSDGRSRDAIQLAADLLRRYRDANLQHRDHQLGRRHVERT